MSHPKHTAPLAPIALFTFKRPEHTLRTLQALASNPEFAASPLHVFCDGARRPTEAADVDATRAVVQDFPHPNKVVHLAEQNRGLSASIVDGVGRLCEEFGVVIVVEDDLAVASVFLAFMNEALERYRHDARVMQISGHQFPVDLGPASTDSVFLPFTTSWGWATWRRAWATYDPDMKALSILAADRAKRRMFDLDNCYPYFAMLKKQQAGLINSWAIRWYLSVFVQGGLVLYPRRSLVNNEGLDGSGTHSKDEGAIVARPLPTSRLSPEAGAPAVDRLAAEAVARHLREGRGPLRQVADWYARLVA